MKRMWLQHGQESPFTAGPISDLTNAVSGKSRCSSNFAPWEDFHQEFSSSRIQYSIYLYRDQENNRIHKVQLHGLSHPQYPLDVSFVLYPFSVPSSIIPISHTEPFITVFMHDLFHMLLQNPFVFCNTIFPLSLSILPLATPVFASSAMSPQSINLKPSWEGALS